MSRWFIDHRQQFIADTLRVFGQINRSTLMDRFDISLQQASADIQLFLKTKPDAMFFDGRAKCYVLNVEALPRETFPPHDDKPDAKSGLSFCTRCGVAATRGRAKFCSPSSEERPFGSSERQLAVAHAPRDEP